MISILSSSHYLHQVNEGEALPNLDAILKPLCREPFRRIDRFIQLALMGSAQCVGNRALAPDCALYVGTGCGPEGNNVIVQETLFKAKLLPKPFNFVNTLGSSTGYYVSKNLGLSGQTLFISRFNASTEAVLMQVATDMELGLVTQALVGIVEECTLPLRDHRRRTSLPPDKVLAEGSHWILLQAGDVADKIATLEFKPAEKASVSAADNFSGYHDSVIGSQMTEFLKGNNSGIFTIPADKFIFSIKNKNF